MAESTTTEQDPRECQVCQNEYEEDDKHSPRILPCTHTFCSDCIDQIISMEGSEKKCPVCRTPIKANSSKEIILNRSTLQLAQMHKKMNALILNPENLATASFETWQKNLSYILHRKSIPVASKGKAVVDEHINKNLELKEHYKKEIKRINDYLIPAMKELSATCESYVAIIDKDNERLGNLSEELSLGQEDLKEINRKVKESKNFATADSLIAEAKRTDAKLQNLMQELKNHTYEAANKFSNMMKELEKSKRKLDIIEDILNQGWRQQQPQPVSSINGALSLERAINNTATPRKLTVADIRYMSDPLRILILRGKIYANHNFDGKQMIGQINETDEGEICIHHMQEVPLPSNSHVIEYADLIKMVDPSCRLTFIDFESESLPPERVFFRLSPDTTAAREFFFMCSGEMGTSYVEGERDIVVGFESHGVQERFGINVNETLLKLDWRSEFQKEEYVRPRTAGLLCGYYRSGTDNGVVIYAKVNLQRYLKGVFGEVYKGLNVVETICSLGRRDGYNECCIKDCGVVIRTI